NPALKNMKTFDRFRGNVLLGLRELIDVDLERKTDLIAVSFDSPYPEEAATIVTAVVSAFSDYCQEERDDKSNKVLTTLRDKKQEQDADINQLKAAVRDFRVKHPMLSPTGDTNSEAMRNLAAISQKLTDTELALIEARATYAPGHRNVTSREQQLTQL